MKKLIFLMAMLWMIFPDMAQAQTRKAARKPAASASKPVTPKQQDDPEYKRLMHELDSLEALRKDLQWRKSLQNLDKKTAKDGTDYQIFAVRGFDDGRGRIYLRIKNANSDARKILIVTLTYDTGKKSEVVGWTVTAPKGIWGNSSWDIDIVGNPMPNVIKKLEIKYKNDIWDNDYVENDKIEFTDLKIEYDD